MSSDCTRWLNLKSGSDIRSREELLTDDRVEKIGFAFADWLAGSLGTQPEHLTIAVGHDSRLSSKRLRAALLRGLSAADADILDCGLCAEPALFMTICDEPHAHGAIMITASHHGADQNGFKFLTEDGGLKEADIEQILRKAEAVVVPERLVKPTDVMRRYTEALAEQARVWLEDDALMPLVGLHVIVDAGNGAGGFYTRFLEDMGADTEGSYNLTPDGNFPAHLPDCQGTSAIETLVHTVEENEADLGVLLDADCDRATLVTADGVVLNKNRLIALTAAIVLNEQPGGTIVTDSVTSSGLTRFISEWGGVHYRFKRGYRNVIDEAVRLNEEGIDCPLAMETSGHAAFRENHFLDDAAYLVTRILCEALLRKREGETLSDLIADLHQSVESCEIRLPIAKNVDADEACREIVEMLLAHTLDDPGWQLAPDSREGARITFNLDGGVSNAWFQVRKSVHEHIIPLNAESDVPGGIKRILRELYDLIGDTELIDVAPLREAAL